MVKPKLSGISKLFFFFSSIHLSRYFGGRNLFDADFPCHRRVSLRTLGSFLCCLWRRVCVFGRRLRSGAGTAKTRQPCQPALISVSVVTLPQALPRSLIVVPPPSWASLCVTALHLLLSCPAIFFFFFLRLPSVVFCAWLWFKQQNR